MAEALFYTSLNTQNLSWIIWCALYKKQKQEINNLFLDINRPFQMTDRLSREAAGPRGIGGYAISEWGSTKINHGGTFRGPSQGYPWIYGQGLEIMRKQSREEKGKTYFCQSRFPSHWVASFPCYPETSYRTGEPSSRLFRWLHKKPLSFRHFCLFYINITFFRGQVLVW